MEAVRTHRTLRSRALGTLPFTWEERVIGTAAVFLGFLASGILLSMASSLALMLGLWAFRARRGGRFSALRAAVSGWFPTHYTQSVQ